MSRPVLVALLLTLLAAAPRGAWAEFEEPRQGLLGPRAASVAGAEAATPDSAEALLYNPAALPASGELHLLMLGGGGAPAAGGLGALGLAAGLSPDLSLGLLWDAQRREQAGGLLGQTLGLSLALRNGGLALGGRLKSHQLQGPALAEPVSGYSADFGLQLQALRLPFLPGELGLGASVDQAWGAWPSESWRKAVPSSANLGLAWRPVASVQVSAERGWTTAYPLGDRVEGAWRAGARWQAANWLELGGGWRQERGGGEWALGTGVGSGGLTGRYAAIWRQDSGSLLHRAGLEWAFRNPWSDPVQIALEQVLEDPDSGTLLDARFSFSVQSKSALKSWRAEVRDAKGALVKSLQAGDRNSRAFQWDGRDAKGLPVKDWDQAQVWLSVLTGEGVFKAAYKGPLRQGPLPKPAAPPAAGSLEPPTARPVFESADSARLSRVEIQMPASPAQAKSWAVDVLDRREASIRRLSGEGALPDKVVWDGRDDKGRIVEDTLGLQVKVAVKDQAGALKAVAMPLFTQEAYSLARRELKARPKMTMAELGLSLLVGRSSVDWVGAFVSDLRAEVRQRQAQSPAEARTRRSSGSGAAKELAKGTWVFDLFDTGSDKIAPARRGQLKPLLRMLKKERRATLVLSGGSLAKEQAGLADRRAMALARHLSSHGAQGLRVLLLPASKQAGFKGVRAELRPQAPGALRARYLRSEPHAGAVDGPGKAPLDKAARRVQTALEGKGWMENGKPAVEPAWSPQLQKLAYFRDGWIWVSSPDQGASRAVWYEPDLQFKGRLEWSEDGSALKVTAGGWRQWICLALGPEAS